MGTLLLVHAHPDDEAISTGGVMLKAKAAGHRVVLVTATRGEAGEIHNFDDPDSIRPRLAEVRMEELRRAGEILGIDRQEYLGYRDSGMVGTPENEDPSCFHQAPLEEAAQRLAGLIRQEKPDVVVGYDVHGGYGHPDHIKVHHVTNAALDLLEEEGWKPRKAYETAIPKERLQQFRQQMLEQDPSAGDDPNSGFASLVGTPEADITTSVDVREYLVPKRAAFGAHVTQNDPKSPLTTMAGQIYEMAFGTEHFVLRRGDLGAPRPEPDLFAGL